MYYISIDVNKQVGKGARDFIKELPVLLKDAETWKLESSGIVEATIASTATMASLPSPPRFKLRENAAGSVQAELLDTEEWSEKQRALAVGPLTYLCMTALSSFVAKIHIDT